MPGSRHFQAGSSGDWAGGHSSSLLSVRSGKSETSADFESRGLRHNSMASSEGAALIKLFNADPATAGPLFLSSV